MVLAKPKYHSSLGHDPSLDRDPSLGHGRGLDPSRVGRPCPCAHYVERICSHDRRRQSQTVRDATFFGRGLGRDLYPSHGLGRRLDRTHDLCTCRFDSFADCFQMSQARRR